MAVIKACQPDWKGGEAFEPVRLNLSDFIRYFFFITKQPSVGFL